MSSNRTNPAATSHAFITIAIPISNDRVSDVCRELDTLNKPARKLLVGHGVHFLSLTVLPNDDTHGAFLLIEGSFDESSTNAIDTIAEHFGTFLIPILTTGDASFRPDNSLAQFLRRHARPVKQGLFGTPGINFTGTPEMSAERIRREYNLSRTVRGIIENGIDGTPLAVIKQVRAQIAADPEFNDLLTPESVKFLEPPNNDKIQVVKIIALAAWTFLWPLLVLAFLILAVAVGVIWYYFGFGMALLSGFSIFMAEALLLAAFLYWVYRRFRSKEMSEPGDDEAPDPEMMKQIMLRENKAEQNHLFGISTMKPGRLRKFTLRLMFWIIGQFAKHSYRPGFLGELGTIHFARWILLPGTNKLLFFSNYGGSWESYLEDFITKAHGGLAGVWSNTKGFPRTNNLVKDGATDGDRFKRWARRQQRPTHFWFAAYPHLTTERIRINAAIRHGLAVAETEDQASTWLSCIGSRPRPAATIETNDVQGIVFGGLRSLRFAECVLVRLPDDKDQARSFLREIESELSFGDTLTGDSALMLALTQTGFSRLGLQPNELRQFPICFQQGMADEHRAKFLGDTGDDEPACWWWGNDEKPVDIALLFYDRTQVGLDETIARQESRLNEYQGSELVHRIALEVPDPNELTREPFGFVDGISQPIIRGTRSWNEDSDPIHVVAPGEFILGYPDDRGNFPRTPTVPVNIDNGNHLPALRRIETLTQVPTFEPPNNNTLRDLGRNGSFLVIRQLEQDTKLFDDFVSHAANSLPDRVSAMFENDKRKMEEWVAAKMVGRWKDGTSLIRYPNRPGNGWPWEQDGKKNEAENEDSVETARPKNKVPPDNSFLNGAEDPMGYRCPFGAHIRRCNPRDSLNPGSPEQIKITNRHRILRMGRPYPTPANATNPGLLFMCLNADIERQFEFIQQTWAMAKQFHGLDGEVDSILGRGGEGGRLTIPTPAGPILIKGLEDFVKVRGGGYFFLPSHRAIRFLSSTN